MKCFKPAVAMLCSLWASFVWGAVFNVLPEGPANISPGDRVSARLEPATPGAQIPRVQGKRIGGLLYVMKQEGAALEAIVAPPKSAARAAPEEGDKFVLKGFDYEHKDVAPLRDYLVADVEYSPPGRTLWILGALALVGMFFTPLAWRKFQARRRINAEKRELRRRLDSLSKLANQAESRRDMEALFPRRNEFERYFDFDKKAFEDYFGKLFEIQYKPKWDEKELREMQGALESFRKELRIKSGI